MQWWPPNWAAITALVAMGSDGTLGEVVNGVLTAEHKRVIPIGAIPAGTGNDFITGNRLFSNLSEAIQALARPKLRQFDVMLVQDADGPSRYAVNSVGVGFDAYVCKRVAELESKKIGSRSYAFEVLRGLLAFQPAYMKISLDGEERCAERAWLCAVMNSQNLGGGLKIIPGAVSDDRHSTWGTFRYSKIRACRPLVESLQRHPCGQAGYSLVKASKPSSMLRTIIPVT